MPFRPFRWARQLRRSRVIVTVLAKYGLKDLASALRGSRRRQRDLAEGRGSETRPDRLRRAFEELGPTFIKLGQLLSVRPDLIPPAYAQALSSLQDAVVPVPFAAIRKVLETELGAQWSEGFAHFDPEPVASASIAQVHRAHLPDGQEVAVKVQRPGIEQVIAADLEILEDLARLLERRLPAGEFYDPVGMVREFERTIRRELDFEEEGQTVERFRRAFSKNPTVHIPRIYRELTGARVLTLEYIHGIKISELEQLEAAGLDRRLIAHNGAELVLKQIFEHGFFHADPHPGNLLVLPSAVLAPIDFGMVGYLDEDLQEALADLLIALIRRDAHGIIRVLAHLGIEEESVRHGSLHRDLTELLVRYWGLPLEQFNLEQWLNELLWLMRTHHLRLPAELVMVGKALTLMEGIGRRLDPGFVIVEQARPYARKLLRRRLSPLGRREDLPEWLETARESGRLLQAAPGDLRAILAKVREGQLKIQFEHRGLERMVTDLDKASNRLAIGLIIAALILGSSWVIQAQGGPLLWGVPAISLLGFALALILALGLLWAIWRSGRL
jgi:ubiquinone biosynthesis protein